MLRSAQKDKAKRSSYATAKSTQGWEEALDSNCTKISTKVSVKSEVIDPYADLRNCMI